MGTYTTNKNLFMPSVGEQGWGELVNGNFSTIDTYLKPISLSGSTYTFTGNHVGNQTGGSISATSITNSGTSTFTGKITANGGIGTKALTTTSISNSGTLTQTGTSTFTGKITANGGLAVGTISGTTGTFSGVVSGTKFTRSTNYTVTSTEQTATSVSHLTYGLNCILPIRDKPYTGTIKLYNTYGSITSVQYCRTINGAIETVSVPGEGYGSITLSGHSCLYIGGLGAGMVVCPITIS